MKGIFWNIRGMGKKSRKQCIIDVVKEYDIDFIGIQETKTREFSNNSLNALSGRKQFCCLTPCQEGNNSVRIGFLLKEVLEAF
jgi:exonuclease III